MTGNLNVLINRSQKLNDAFLLKMFEFNNTNSYDWQLKCSDKSLTKT